MLFFLFTKLKFSSSSACHQFDYWELVLLFVYVLKDKNCVIFGLKISEPNASFALFQMWS